MRPEHVRYYKVFTNQDSKKMPHKHDKSVGISYSGSIEVLLNESDDSYYHNKTI